MSQSIRIAARAVILDEQRVLLTENRDDQGTFCLCPGGGQLHGETLVQALLRECREEIGVEVDIGDLLFARDYVGVHHEFAATEPGVHQVELYFLCRLASGNPPTSGDAPDAWQTGVRWVLVEDLDQVRLYPAALVEPLRSLARGEGVGPTYLGDVN